MKEKFSQDSIDVFEVPVRGSAKKTVTTRSAGVTSVMLLLDLRFDQECRRSRGQMAVVEDMRPCIDFSLVRDDRYARSPNMPSVSASLRKAFR